MEIQSCLRLTRNDPSLPNAKPHLFSSPEGRQNLSHYITSQSIVEAYHTGSIHIMLIIFILKLPTISFFSHPHHKLSSTTCAAKEEKLFWQMAFICHLLRLFVVFIIAMIIYQFRLMARYSRLYISRFQTLWQQS